MIKRLVAGFVAFWLFTVALTSNGPAMLLPPFFLDGVVALGSEQSSPPVGQQPPRKEWQTTGTAFFYGYAIDDNPDLSKRQYEIFLVTAKHVVEILAKSNRNISARLNPTDSTASSKQFEIPSSAWFYHPDNSVDIALLPTNPTFLRTHGLEPFFFANDQHSANRKDIGELQISAGDGVFVLGFPMGLSGQQRNYVIVRQGAIARISEMLDGVAPSFIIDAQVYPGNSGGPVILKPEIASIDGTKNQPRALLVGIVRSYLPYTDVAVSRQTGQTRIIFQENSGLAEVLPIDFINEAIATWRIKKQTPPLAAPK